MAETLIAEALYSEQLDEDMVGATIKLSQEEFDAINQISKEL